MSNIGRRRLGPRVRLPMEEATLRRQPNAENSSGNINNAEELLRQKEAEMQRKMAEMQRKMEEMQRKMDAMTVADGSAGSASNQVEDGTRTHPESVAVLCTPESLNVQRPKDRPRDGGLWWTVTTEWLDAQYSRDTRRTYCTTLCVLDALLAHFEEDLSDTEKIHFNITHIRKLQEYFKEKKKYCTGTRNQYMIKVKALCTFLFKRGLTGHLNMSKLIVLEKCTREERNNKKKKSSRTQRKRWTHKLWEQEPPKKSHYSQKLDRLLIALLYRFGLRIFEAVKVKGCHILTCKRMTKSGLIR